VSVSVAGLIVTANFLGEVIGLMALGLTHARWNLGQRLGVGTALFGVGLLAAAARREPLASASRWALVSLDSWGASTTEPDCSLNWTGSLPSMSVI